MVTDEQSLLDDIIKLKNELPKKQRKLCDYILKNYQSLGLITIKELSVDSGVGISTVMRTIHALGYENFNDFKRDLYEESLTEKQTSKWALRESLTVAPSSNDQEHTLVKVWKESVKLLDRSLEEGLIENFQYAVSLIVSSSYINVFGTRPYKPVALYFEQLIGEFYPRVGQLSHDTEVVFDKVLQFEKDEVLLVFAFEPYTNRVIEASKLAHKRGTKIILVTDYISCPLIEHATVVLQLEVSSERFSLAPVIALVEALVIEVGKHFSEESIKKLNELEETLKAHHVTYSN